MARVGMHIQTFALFICIIPLFIQLSYCRSILNRSSYQKLHLASAFQKQKHEEIINVTAYTEDMNVQEEGSLTLKLMHRHAVDSPFRLRNLTRKHLLLESIARDEIRLSSIKAHVNSATNRPSKRGHFSIDPKNVNALMGDSNDDFDSPVSSGLSLGSGEYFVRMGVGTPSTDMYLVIDTGSDLPWIQCYPCTRCYEQTDPVFYPRSSSSYQQFGCSSAMCQRLDVRGSCSRGSGCKYTITYDDGSVTTGELATESFSDGMSVVDDVAFGCGHDNEGVFLEADGILGLGSGPLSFSSQLGSRFGNAFSYCLVGRDRAIRYSSTLIVGSSAISSSAESTPLVDNPRLATFYFVPLTGISIGGFRLPIPASTFSIGENGNGGVVIDTGTSVSRFTNSAYVAMRTAFRAFTRELPSAPAYSIFDTCYDLSKTTGRWVNIPAIIFHFEDGQDLDLPASNYLIEIEDSPAGTYCFAFSGSSMPLSIIGNIQQQGIRVAIDGENKRIAFDPGQC